MVIVLVLAWNVKGKPCWLAGWMRSSVLSQQLEPKPPPA